VSGKQPDASALRIKPNAAKLVSISEWRGCGRVTLDEPWWIGLWRHYPAIAKVLEIIQ